jgi:histidine ammonia-lyase
MTAPQDISLGTARLAVADIDAVASQRATVRVDVDARARIDAGYAFMLELAHAQTPVYGLTTGCGPLASQSIPAERREEFQRNLVRSHAVTLGPPHPTEFVRAAMAVRAHVLAQGHSGVAGHTIDVLVAMLNHGVHPIVREVGSVGASGDLVELAQIALAVLGEGVIEQRGEIVPAAEGLRTVGIEPVIPRHREGLALMNGTSFHTGTAAVLLARAGRLVDAAVVGAALALEALRANLEAFDPALHAARPHPGQRAVAARIAALVSGSRLMRDGESSAGSQDAYTLRCTPQILGPVLDALRTTRSLVETEINAVSDNPLFLPGEGRVIHGGNFHGQPVAMALDQLKAALVELGVLSERRLARLLDAKLNAGLPPFLVTDGASLRSGFMGLQYCASAMAADNAVLAAPAASCSVSTNASNQDVVSMGMVAARQTRQVIDNAMRMVAIELLCAAQALDQRDAGLAGAGTRVAHALIRRHVPGLIEDRPMAPDVDAVCHLIDSGALEQPVTAALVAAGL